MDVSSFPVRIKTKIVQQVVIIAVRRGVLLDYAKRKNREDVPPDGHMDHSRVTLRLVIGGDVTKQMSLEIGFVHGIVTIVLLPVV